MKRSIAFVSLLLAQLAPAARPQEQEPPRFPAGVEQVIVDAVVTDKKGNPIPGLGAADFSVLEDGVRQEIVSFEAIQVAAEPAAVPAPRAPVSTNVRPEDRTARTFVLVFDDVHMTRYQSVRAQAAVAEFLKKGVREGDRVTLVATGGAAWWSTRMEAGREELLTLLRRLEGRRVPDNSPERMSEYEAMRIHVYNDADVMDRVRRRFENLGVAIRDDRSSSRGIGDRGDHLGDGMVRGRASDVYFQSVNRNRITLEVLARVLDALSQAKGRKSVLLVSEGFIYDPNLDEFKQVVQASRRGNAAVYFVDTRGLGGLSDLYSAEFASLGTDPRDVGPNLLDSVQAAEGAEGMASDTGGFTVKNTNDLAAGIQRIANETRVYYLLGYNPTNASQDGRFRKIQVKLARKGIEVRARKGYYAPLEGKPKPAPKPGQVDPAVQQALDSPYESDEIPMRMTAFVFDETLLGKLSTLVATEVDLRPFAFQQQEGRLADTLEFQLVVAHRETGEYYQYSQKVEMKLLPATRERLHRSWYPIVRDFELAPGGYQAKIVVRDKNNGRVGSVVHEFQVPEPTAFRTSSVVLSDTLQPNAEGAKEGPPRPMYVVRRAFPAGAMLWAQFSVFGAQKGPSDSMPNVSAGWLIRDKEGRVVGQGPASTIQPTSLGRLSRLVGTSLEGYEPGDYDFVLTLKDELAGKSLELVEPFSVTPEAPAAG